MPPAFVNRLPLLAGSVMLCGASILLAGCGLAETTVGAASSAAASVQEAKQGQQTEAHVREELAKDEALGKAQREQAEKDAQ